MKPNLGNVDPLAYNLATRANVGDTLTRSAALFGSRTAVIDGANKITYRELNAASHRFGQAINTLEVTPGTPVAMLQLNSWQFLATFYGLALAGRTAQPLNIMLNPADLIWIVSDSQAEILVVDAPLIKLAEAIAARVPTVKHVLVIAADSPDTVGGKPAHNWQKMVDDAPDASCETLVEENSAALCLYTSGTTARPKGVLLRHTAVTLSLFSNALGFGMQWGGKPPVMMVVLPLFHVTALNALTLPVILLGGTVVMPGMQFDPAKSLDTVVEHQVTHFLMLPMMMAACLQENAKNPRELGHVQRAFYAMAPMSAQIREAVSAMFPNAAVILGSGQTEVIPATTTQWPQHEHTSPDSWGPQSAGVLTQIMDQNGQIMSAGQTGEIVYRSPHATMGYWNNPEANEEAFAGGWFHSSDMGHLDEEGVVWFTDRLKDIIKSGGENVSSVVVEAAVMGAPGVAECSVIGIPDQVWGEAVCAVVIPDGSVPEADLAETIIAYARENLSRFQVPKEVRIIAEFPKTATGKILKHEVRQQVE